jgi:dienelactone hydrolase
VRARLYEASGRTKGLAVLMFDGAGGGYPTDPQAPTALAAKGYPTLAAAYFRNRLGEPDGLPVALSEIPLEYGLACIDWLQRSPGIAPRGVVVVGQSRGAELALLLASRCPTLAGVVAFSPSDAVWQSGTYDGDPKSAWTEGGHPLPFRSFAYAAGAWDPEAPVGVASVAEAPAAAIPVERIRCPTLLISSKDDRIWPAAKMSDAVSERMSRAGNPPQTLQFDDASHILMGFGPGPVRVTAGVFTMLLGGSEEGTRTARDEGWAAMLQFLERIEQAGR